MQLSTPSAPSDPNLAALLFAAPTPGGMAQVPSATPVAAGEAAGFETLFAELTPPSAPQPPVVDGTAGRGSIIGKQANVPAEKNTAASELWIRGAPGILLAPEEVTLPPSDTEAGNEEVDAEDADLISEPRSEDGSSERAKIEDVGQPVTQPQVVPPTPLFAVSSDTTPAESLPATGQDDDAVSPDFERPVVETRIPTSGIVAAPPAEHSTRSTEPLPVSTPAPRPRANNEFSPRVDEAAARPIDTDADDFVGGNAVRTPIADREPIAAPQQSAAFGERTFVAPTTAKTPTFAPAATSIPFTEVTSRGAQIDSPSVFGAMPEETLMPATPESGPVTPARPIMARESLPAAPAPEAVQANFAAAPQEKFPAPRMAFSVERRSFVTADGERLAQGHADLGIGTAKIEAHMPVRAAHAPFSSSHPETEYVSSAAVATNSAGEVSAPTAVATPHASLPHPVAPVQAASHVAPDSPAPISSPHQAVEAVLNVVEHASTRDQKIVNLQFSVGDADLSVRVELHAEEVHTTFRTDSPELRATLSQEWQAVASSNHDRTVRLAPAVFTTNDSSSLNASTGDGASRQQREQSAPQQESTARHFAGAPLRGAPAAATSSSEPAAYSAATSHRLHTFA